MPKCAYQQSLFFGTALIGSADSFMAKRACGQRAVSGGLRLSAQGSYQRGAFIGRICQSVHCACQQSVLIGFRAFWKLL